MPSSKLIVSRHPAAIEFIRQAMPEFSDAPVRAEVTPADMHGRVVAGNVPLHLAALADCVFAVEFRGQAPRGAEYTLADMVTAGAHLCCYTVKCEPHARFADDGWITFDPAPAEEPAGEIGGYDYHQSRDYNDARDRWGR